MSTSPANRVSQSVDVTPDCVVQVGNELGLVAEAKLGLPRLEAAWDDDIDQMQKYDDDLMGWWTENEKIRNFDIVGLLPLERSVKFADRLENGLKTGRWKFDRRWSVIGFFKKSGIRDFMTLKKERGELSEGEFDRRIRESVPIAFDQLIVTYRDRKFVDQRPPLSYLLQVIWDDLFTRYAADVARSDQGEPVQLQVSVQKATDDLQTYYGFRSNGTRSPEIPRQIWIREALDLLVRFRMATRNGDEYTIRYKRTRGDTLKRFGRLCFRDEQKRRKGSPNQLALLPPAT